MVRCLTDGIIPNVILLDGDDTYELEVPYEETQSGTEGKVDGPK